MAMTVLRLTAVSSFGVFTALCRSGHEHASKGCEGFASTGVERQLVKRRHGRTPVLLLLLGGERTRARRFQQLPHRRGITLAVLGRPTVARLKGIPQVWRTMVKGQHYRQGHLPRGDVAHRALPGEHLLTPDPKQVV